MKKIILLLLLSVSAFAQREIEQKRIENLADSLAKKVNKVTGKQLSTNDYTNTEKNKLAEIPSDVQTQINNKKQLVISISDLKAFSGTIADFDGSTWEKKSGDKISNGGDYAGTVIRVSGSVYWERKFSGKVSVKWFGAVGDGTTDDTDAMNAAVTAHLSIYAPTGNYKLVGSLYLRSNQELSGDGASTVFHKYVDGTGEVIGIVGESGNPVTNVSVHDIAINCHNVVNLNGIGVAYAEKCIINNVWVFNAGRKAFTFQYEVFDNILSNSYADGGESTMGIISLEDPTFLGLCKRNIVKNITIGNAVDWIITMDGADDCIVSDITGKSSLRGIVLNKCNDNIIENIKTSCTNKLIQFVGSSRNKFSNIKNQTTSTSSNAVSFDAIPCYDNIFEKIEATSSADCIMLNSYSIRSKFSNCTFTSTTTGDVVYGDASSVSNKFLKSKLTANVRVFNLEGNDTEINSCVISSANSGIQLNSVTSAIITNNSISSVGNSIFLYLSSGANVTNNKVLSGNAPILGTNVFSYNNSFTPSVQYATTFPTTGTYKVGDIVYNSSPSSGGVLGWVCTVAGTSGTWKPISNIDLLASSNTFSGNNSFGNDVTINNLKVGLGGGAITSNAILGNSAGFSNTTGNQNLFAGATSGFSNTTGSDNAFSGRASGESNTTGTRNSFFGSSAGRFNTSGTDNVGVGGLAGINNSTGGSNVFIGSSAGRYITGGSTANAISNNSIYIGFDTRASANNQTNQIVIGYQSTGLGSNTTVLGNSSTTTTAIYGSLLLGTTTDVPSSALTISSTTRGVLLPRMTTAQINAISSPADGLIVYNTDIKAICFFESATSSWKRVSHSNM